MQLRASVRCFGRLGFLLLIIVGLQTAYAGSATWDINPPTNDWNTATNWTPNTVPNSPNDIATFDGSNVHDVIIHSDVELNAIVFTDDLNNSATITVGDASTTNVVTFTLSGTGIVTDPYNQFYSVEAAPALATSGARNTIFLTNDATLAEATVLRAQGGTGPGSVGGQVLLLDNSTVGPGAATAGAGENGGSAGEIWFLDNSSASGGGSSNGDLSAFGSGAGSTPGQIIFKGTSTASDAYMDSWGATAAGVEGGKISFLESSNAGDFVINALSGGGGVPGAGGGSITFSDTASAGSAHLEAFGSTISGGGLIQFLADSTGGTAQVELQFGKNAKLSISDHNPPGVTIGSLKGVGVVSLGSNNLTIGSNNLSTIFKGVIEGNGSVIKIGTGTLALRGTNTYVDGTTVSGGVLRVANLRGSVTGAGPVNVRSGTLAGDGTIGGPVSVGARAFLGPNSGHSHNNLTIQSALSFLTASTYSCRIEIATLTADQVLAHGVTIANGARFELATPGSGTLAIGTTFTILSNTSADPISGTFDNLADGAIIIVKANKFQASYEGGDGNDLVLTVVP